MGKRNPYALIIVIIAILLAIVHQDYWWWDSTYLVFGFLPIGLAYHAGFSIAAGLLWLATVQLAWPEAIEQWAEGEAEGEGK